MCDRIDWLNHLSRAWLDVGALADSLEGDQQRIARCVAVSVRHDIEEAVKQWRAEREQKK